MNKIIRQLMGHFGFIHETDVTKALRDMRNEVLRLTQINRGLNLTGETLVQNHLTMHRRMVDAEKGLAHAEEEVKHLKSMLVEQIKLKSPVTRVVTVGSLKVAGNNPNMLIPDGIS